jgi:hypothetical protein
VGAREIMEVVWEKIDFESLLTDTKTLLEKMFYVRESFDLLPDHEHIGTCIGYSDLLELDKEFINELTNRIINFVYSKENVAAIIKKLKDEGRDEPQAYSELLRRSHAKFRKGNLKGQFSELLIFNLLQHHFKAVPVLRKMKITTNPTVERHGADAIHLAKDGKKLKLFLAECKTYDAKEKNFQNAFHDSLNDIVLHYSEHRSELDLYNFEEFIPEPLEKITRDYLEGKLDNIEVNLVCMVSYRNEGSASGSNKTELLDSVIESLRTSAKKINKALLAKKIPDNLMPRIHYVFFPINDVEGLLEKFGERLTG